MLANDRTPYMLSERHFAITMLVALILHLGGFVVWTITPKSVVQQLQIRTMNIRLGEADEITPEMLTTPVAPVNAPQLEAMVDKLARDTLALKAPSPPTDAAKQYVREVNTQKTKKAGVRDGKRDAEIMSRYTQMISLWIQKFKLYPEEARQKNLKGSTVVRIRIDRRGNIGYYALERTTGVEALDRAAIDMIRRANPVPAVPDDYPPGDTFEFLIPVNFTLL